MAPDLDFLTTTEVADRLGVSVQHVRRLLDEGDLTRVARGLVDATSVDRYLAVAAGRRTRAWAEHTAWGAIALLSGVHPDWLGPVQASRLRGALRETTDPTDLVAKARDRAVVRTYAGHATAAARMLHDMVTTDLSGLGLVTTDTDRVDGYFAADRLDATVQFLGLAEDPGGAITVRATNFDLSVVADLATHGVVLAAIDAAASLDPRERGVGERALAEALDRFRR